jgi:hypothetical protein
MAGKRALSIIDCDKIRGRPLCRLAQEGADPSGHAVPRGGANDPALFQREGPAQALIRSVGSLRPPALGSARSRRFHPASKMLLHLSSLCT